MKGNTVAKHAHKYNKSAVMRDRKKDAKKGKVKHKGRDYAKEYANYHSRPEQIKRRAARNAARRAMRGRKELTDEKDVHHKDNNPMNNDKSNLSIVTQHYNRREPRLRVEDLRKWFGKGKKGDWVRVGTDGEIKGDCAREPGEGKPKCMPRSKAHSMDKKDRASSARRKRRADPSVDRPGTGNKPIMVKTDKKKNESMNENVNMKNVDKLKAAARDFGKNKDRNSKSIEDALLTIVQSMRVLDKSTSGRADVKHEKIISKEIVRINNIVNKTNYGKTGQSEEGKEIVKILNKHKLNGPRGFHKVVYEGVEMNEASKVPAGMKFIASYVYKDANGKDHTHRHLRKGTKMTDPVVVYIDGKEWKTFQSFTKAKQAAINHIKGMKESVEMNEQFVVKYAKNKRGPIYQTKFSTQGEAEKFLAQKRKEGMNGIVSKAGKPVSMQKMKDLQKESIDENKIFFVKVGDGRDSMTVKTKAKNSREALKKMRSEHPKSRVSLDINQKQGQPAGALESVEVKDFFGLREAKASAQFTDHTPDKNFNDLAKKHKVKVTHDKKGEKTTIHGDENAVQSVLKTMYGNDWKYMYTKKGSVYVDESVEQLDELSPKTVDSYLRKRSMSKDRSQRTYQQKARDARKAGDEGESEKNRAKAKKIGKGINRAVARYHSQRRGDEYLSHKSVKRVPQAYKDRAKHGPIPKDRKWAAVGESYIEEKNVPTNPALWSKIKSQAKAKFDVYPSAYANGWAAKQYKAAGGGWKTTKESTEMKSFWDIREGSCGTMNAQTKKDEKPPFVPNRKVGVKKDKFGNVVKDKNRAKHLAKMAMRGEDVKKAADMFGVASQMKKGRNPDAKVGANRQARRDAYKRDLARRGIKK